MNSETIKLTKMLMSIASITPNDGLCQKIIAERLTDIGFEITELPFGNVKNIWARRGNAAPLFVFLGHTDVVPTGPLEQWLFPPFTPTEHKGYLYGRGAADMKSNIAAMVTACERFIGRHPTHKGSIAFLLTSDEEGPAVEGTVKVMEYLQEQGTHLDYCLVGEPSSHMAVGDTLKVGRRGSLSAHLVIHGKQGHIAYPDLASNPIHSALPALTELIHTRWDSESYGSFPATSLQISNFHSGTGASNIIPGECQISCNFRYSPCVTAETLQQQFETVLKKYVLDYSITWQHSAKPFFTEKGSLVEACVQAIESQCGITPILSTSGGTSDGRFVAPFGTEVIELGVCNATIHQIDECVKLSDVDTLSLLYEKILERLLTSSSD